jgi:hypothetical protein
MEPGEAQLGRERAPFAFNRTKVNELGLNLSSDEKYGALT